MGVCVCMSVRYYWPTQAARVTTLKGATLLKLVEFECGVQDEGAGARATTDSNNGIVVGKCARANNGANHNRWWGDTRDDVEAACSRVKLAEASCQVRYSLAG